MTATTYPVHITLHRKNPTQVTPELESFIDFVVDEWEERKQDEALKRAIESDGGLSGKLDLMRHKIRSGNS